MLNYILYIIGKFIALRIPLKVAYFFAVFISDLHYITSKADRDAVWANLKVIFPDKTNEEIRVIRRRMFRNFAKYLVDFFRFSKVDEEYIRKNVKVENIYHFDQALKRNKGVIVLTAHLGNWELGGVVISLSGYPFWVVALSHKNKKVNDFFIAQRQSKGIQVIPMGGAARQCFHLLKENKMVALVGDRDFTEKGIKVDFFGKKTYLPLGPAFFAMKTQAAIITGFMLRNPDDTFTLKINKPVEFDMKEQSTIKPQDKEEYLLKIIDTYKVVMEDYIRKYPDQWYMFRRFWIE